MPRIDTIAIHTGDRRIGGAITTPIFQSAMFDYAGEQGYDAVRYIRLNNTPNHEVLDARLAALEGGEGAFVAASGMAAMSAVLLSVLSSGDRLLAFDQLYGGTHDLLSKDLPALGIQTDFIDGERPETWKARLTQRTRAILCEPITNPLVRVPDVAGAGAFAGEHGLVSIIDNTFATPVNFRPIERGFDLVHHSATKYLNGHSDIVAGAVVGRKALVEKALYKLNHLGGSLDPHACFLLERGLKTLPLRVRQHNANALAVAKFLGAHPKVVRVNYPGLETHPNHRRARELFSGFGGMLSFELTGGVPAAESFLRSVTIPRHAPSLGGVESLVVRPVTTSHAGMSPEDRKAAGISDALIRMSVGLESADDLIEDLDHALT